MLRTLPKLLARMGSLAANDTPPLRRSSRASVLRSMTTTKAALIQEGEDMAMFTATVEETRVEIPDVGVRPRQRGKRSLGDEVESGVSVAVEDGHDRLKKRRMTNKQAASKEEIKKNVQSISEREILVKSSTGRKRKAKAKEPEEVVGSVDETGQLIRGSPVKKRKKKKVALAGEGDEAIGAVNEAGEPIEGAPVKVKRKRKVKEEPVYIIPDVEKKTTTFKGRLGYACLNTVLRNKKPAAESVFCSRTCRIDSIKKNGMGWVKDLGRKNVQDLLVLIQWNEDNNIKFMRLSSEMFPFASHPKYGYTLEYCADVLAEAGALANKYGHRLTVHPGQFTQLGSNKPAVIVSAIRELEYHCQMLDLMGIGPDGVMIVHGGGVYEDKEATISRIKHTIRERLPANVRARLVLENDEMCYNAEDLLGICEELDVPLVFDYHHDQLKPSSIPPSSIIARANVIFAKRGIKPKQHLSEPRPGAVTLMERRAHADRCEALPPDLPDDMDLMIEAKDKEQAVLHLYRMYDLQSVKHESLRPPAENQTKETKGRKSTKAAKGAQSPAKKKGKAKAAISDEETSELDSWPSEGESETEGQSASDLDAQLAGMEEEPKFVEEEQVARAETSKPGPRATRTRGNRRTPLD